MNQQVASTQFRINSLSNIKIFNYRSNFQHFLKHLPFSSAVCQPNADTWEKKLSPWWPEAAERQVHTTFCLCNILHFVLLPFWNIISIKIWVGLILSALDLSQLQTQCPCFAYKCRSLKMKSNYMKAKWDIASLPKWKFHIYKTLQGKKKSYFSGHNDIDNDKGINKTPTTLCICLRHKVSATDS